MYETASYTETVEVQWIEEDQNIGALIGLLVNKVLSDNDARDYNVILVRAKARINHRVLCEVRVTWQH